MPPSRPAGHQRFDEQGGLKGCAVAAEAADDLNAELGRVHEQNTALIAAIAKPADTDKGKKA